MHSSIIQVKEKSNKMQNLQLEILIIEFLLTLWNMRETNVVILSAHNSIAHDMSNIDESILAL